MLIQIFYVKLNCVFYGGCSNSLLAEVKKKIKSMTRIDVELGHIWQHRTSWVTTGYYHLTTFSGLTVLFTVLSVVEFNHSFKIALQLIL